MIPTTYSYLILMRLVNVLKVIGILIMIVLILMIMVMVIVIAAIEVVTKQ